MPYALSVGRSVARYFCWSSSGAGCIQSVRGRRSRQLGRGERCRQFRNVSLRWSMSEWVDLLVLGEGFTEARTDRTTQPHSLFDGLKRLSETTPMHLSRVGANNAQHSFLYLFLLGRNTNEPNEEKSVRQRKNTFLIAIMTRVAN